MSDIQNLNSFPSLTSFLKQRNYHLIVFDFGGTLFDFSSLHVKGFLYALDIPSESETGILAKQAIKDSLLLGLDSFAILSSIQNHINLSQKIDFKEVVVKKRIYVENCLANLQLKKDASDFLSVLLKFSIISIVSFGFANSIKKILIKSLGKDKTNLIKIYGRQSNEERIIKFHLLNSAINEYDFSKNFIVYIGDSEVDKSIAKGLGIDSIVFRPFE